MPKTENEEEVSRLFDRLEEEIMNGGDDFKNITTVKPNASALLKTIDVSNIGGTVTKTIKAATNTITTQLKPPLHFLRDKVIHTAGGEALDETDPGNMRIKNMQINDPSSHYRDAIKRRNNNGQLSP